MGASWGLSAQLMRGGCSSQEEAQREAQQTCAWDLTPSFLAQLPREPRARPKRGGGSPGSPWDGLLTKLDPKHPLQPQPPRPARPTAPPAD